MKKVASRVILVGEVKAKLQRFAKRATIQNLTFGDLHLQPYPRFCLQVRHGYVLRFRGIDRRDVYIHEKCPGVNGTRPSGVSRPPSRPSDRTGTAGEWVRRGAGWQRAPRPSPRYPLTVDGGVVLIRCTTSAPLSGSLGQGTTK